MRRERVGEVRVRGRHVRVIRRKSFALLAASAVALSLSACASAEEDSSEVAEIIASETLSPRPTMRVVFEEIKTLLPLSLDEERWSRSENRRAILASLDRLERAAALVERHGRWREAGFGELALNLGNDLREARSHYAEGGYSEARFFLMGSLQNCVSCHTRLPSSIVFPHANELTDRAEVRALDLREQAWLHVIVRRFDEALALWEALLADPTISPDQLDASGVLFDYLNIALRVQMDVPRVRAALSTVARRIDLPVYLGGRLKTWQESLDSIDAKRFGSGIPASVDYGAELASSAGGLADGPYGRDGLILDLAAANQLVRFLEADRARDLTETRNRTPSERTSVARAYYWLGIVEARSLDGFWVNLSERHFESAIRVDPRGPFAMKAYAQLEEVQVLGYGGASGQELPADVWADLRELRTLMGIEN